MDSCCCPAYRWEQGVGFRTEGAPTSGTSIHIFLVKKKKRNRTTTTRRRLLFVFTVFSADQLDARPVLPWIVDPAVVFDAGSYSVSLPWNGFAICTVIFKDHRTDHQSWPSTRAGQTDFDRLVNVFYYSDFYCLCVMWYEYCDLIFKLNGNRLVRLCHSIEKSVKGAGRWTDRSYWKNESFTNGQTSKWKHFFIVFDE